jgi:hypothetical protein
LEFVDKLSVAIHESSRPVLEYIERVRVSLTQQRAKIRVLLDLRHDGLEKLHGVPRLTHYRRSFAL